MATNPMDQRVIERVNPVSGVKEQLPALHKAWCEDINFLPFSPPSCPPSPEWSQLIEAVDSDLHLLLTLPHHRFWSQAIHDQTLHLLLDSYLQHAPRPYEDPWNLSHSERELLRNVHRRVFLVLLRLSTYKESAEHFLSVEAFADNIYKHYLFDVPRILDLCGVYGASNAQLVSKMVDNIFNNQILYRMDLRLSLGRIKKLLSGITRKCGDVGGAHSDSSDGESSEDDGDTTLRLDSVRTLSRDDLVSSVIHIADITHSLLSLLNIYPAAAPIFWGEGFTVRLIKFYRSVIPNLQRQVKNFIGENGRAVRQMLRVAKKNIPTIVHNLLINSGNEELQLDQVLNVVTTLTGAKPFLREFQKHFDLKECLTNVAKHHPNLDSTQLTYLLSPITDAATPTLTAPIAACDNNQPPVEYIQELFPELEQDFIEACLREFQGNVESVLSALLDGTLPSYLVMKRSLESAASLQRYSEPLPAALAQSEEANVLDQRVNVFDRDGFDVFHGGVDLRKVHIGKRHQSAKSILSDRSHVSLMKNSGLDYVYEDEYDDTYDSHNVGAIDHDSADELFTVKRLNQKGLRHSRYVAKDDDSDEDDEEEEEEEKEPVVPFGAPVRILQRPGQQGTQGKGRGGGGKRKGGDSHFAGKQGEEKGKNPTPQNTARQYHLKEKNKGSRANHNRRVLADKKRNKGLF